VAKLGKACPGWSLEKQQKKLHTARLLNERQPGSRRIQNAMASALPERHERFELEATAPWPKPERLDF
jgi:hypothetical protein